MEVGKEQQAQARRNPAAVYLPHSGQSSWLRRKLAAAHYRPGCGPAPDVRSSQEVNTEAGLI